MLIVKVGITIVLALVLMGVYERWFKVYKVNKIGDDGENKIVEVLKELEDSSRIVKGVYLKNAKGNTVQVDVILVAKNGLYVIESKNYSGSINGGVEYAKWFYRHKSGAQYKVYNPIRQNKGHVNAVIEALGVDKGSVVSYIVFGEGTTSIKVKGDTDAKVVKLSEFGSIIGKELDARENIFSQEDVNNYVEVLNKGARNSSIKKIKHVKQVKKRVG